jgi:hypothetical protein
MTIPVSSSGDKGDPRDGSIGHGSIVMQNIQQGKSVKLNPQ